MVAVAVEHRRVALAVGHRMVAVAVALALVVLAPKLAWGKAFDPADTQWEGCSALVEVARATLGAERVVVATKLDWSKLDPKDGLLVLHPSAPIDGDDLAAFLGAGGRAAVLDDFGAGDQVLARFHIDRVPAPEHPAAMLRHNPRLAIAEPAGEVVAGYSQGVHPVVADVEKLVTNHPTGLRHPKLAPVLRIRGAGEPDVVLALAGVVGQGQGRLFAMGDPSAVINQMLRYPGNRAFAAGLVKYLVEDDSTGRHGGRVFLLANDIAESGTYGGDGSAYDELENRLRDLAAAIRSVGESGLPAPLAIALAAAASIGVGVFTALVAARTYRRLVPRFARRIPLVAQGGVAGRAAVLAAETTSPALAMLELKSALEEGLGHALGFDKPAPTVLLLEAVRARGALDEAGYGALRDVLLRMANVETSVAAGQPERVKASELERTSRIVAELLASAEARLSGREATA